MKAIRTHLVLTAIALVLTSCYASRNAYAQEEYDNEYEQDYGYPDYDDDNYPHGGISLNVFYNELRPYGRWMNSRAYGRVWIPDVGRNFHPYATNGYWVMTDYGNTWVSDYSWGWAPFHYGRWYYDDYYGWAWIPGSEWAPAWVTWRSGGGYYGWAPMGHGVHISVHINLPAHYWTFLPNRYMYHRNMHRYYNRYSPSIYNRTTVINNTYIYHNNRYYSGPSAGDYRRETGRTTTIRRLESTANRSGRSTRVSNNAVSVYRPEASGVRSSRSRSTVDDRSATTRSRSNSTTRQTPATPANRSTTTTSRSATVRTEKSPSTGTRTTTGTTTRSTNRTSTRSTPATTTTRSTPATRQSSSSSSTRNATATQQSSRSGSNRSSTVQSRNSSTNSSRNAATTRSSSRSSTRESSSSGRSSGRR